MIKTATIDEVYEAVNIVWNECNGNLPLKFKIRETAEELYGQEAVKQYPRLKQVQGAYYPRGQLVVFTSSAILFDSGNEMEDGGKIRTRSPGVVEALIVARHEVLGHYGLNTCTKDEKLRILNKIIECRNEPFLRKEWENLQGSYDLVSNLTKAEEVFCFTAEKKPVLNREFSFHDKPFSIEHVEQLAAKIAEGIRLGLRTQQIFPKDDHSPFSIKSNFNTKYTWSSSDQQLHLTINDQSPDKIPEKLLATIASKDRFLKNYSLEQIQSGKLELSQAKGTQPVPKQYDEAGQAVREEKKTQPLQAKA
ncbi:hypothetical protein L0B53_00230 [Vibrio sp. SS-MA-C1-2]|uniref:hypothetical protein n=1 Tax=Vibrio sp. SS-MA-C1-2 TaxID=2908646 RepID=UPI001F26D291|nr:hypothetical protein [Vibrio sp. SS-MA-C1-2]UJF17239.1 hypothetical protein L0B53_00230 [Vibrio sp. SS-MA-C1-2]